MMRVLSACIAGNRRQELCTSLSTVVGISAIPHETHRPNLPLPIIQSSMIGIA
jgi:hypothetical protein